MSDWAAGTCPRAGECSFYNSVTSSAVLRVKYATMFPYCKGGRHESCMRYWEMSKGRAVSDDLLPDGGRDLFASEARGRFLSTQIRVMVVDDMPLFRKSLVGMVTAVAGANAEVVEAESGETAYRLLMEDPAGWTLLITDYNMGAMSGYELIEHMHAQPSLAGVPAIVFSSESDRGIQQKCAALPRVRWLVKKPDRGPFEDLWKELVIEGKL